MKKKLISLFIILICISTVLNFNVAYANPDWLTGWTYRKSHVVNNATGTGTNYQIKITVHYGSSSDSGENVYLSEHCRTDFGDVRFTDNDGSTLLDYWLESKVDSDYAIFWVEVADDLSTVNQTIYCYYGKSDATTTSNGDNTFPFFDDFPGSAIDTTKWQGDGLPYTTVSGGIMHYTRNAAIDTAIGQNSTNYPLYPYPMAMRFKGFFERGATIPYIGSGFRESAAPAGNDVAYFYVHGSGTNYIATRREGTQTSVASNYPTDTWSVYSILWTSSKVRFYFDSTECSGSPLTTNIPLDNLGVWFYINTRGYTYNYLELDWVFSRKYADPEPSHGAWGNQEVSKAWYKAESWKLSIHNYSWFLIETWTFALRNPIWITVETWLIKNLGSAWITSETWNLINIYAEEIFQPSIPRNWMFYVGICLFVIGIILASEQINKRKK